MTYVLNPGKNRTGVLANLVAFLGGLDPEKAWRITVKRETSERSEQQNRYLFGVAYPVISELTGTTVADLHEYFCGEFFGWREVKQPVPGRVTMHKPVRTTTTDEDGKRDVMSSHDFGRFVDIVKARGAFIGAFVPDPQITARGDE